jgi:integrase
MEQTSTRTEDQERAWTLAMILCLGYELSQKPRVPRDRLRCALRELYNIGTAEDWPIYSIREYLDQWKSGHHLFVGGAADVTQKRAIQLFEKFMGDERLDWLLDQLTPTMVRNWTQWLVEEAGHSRESAIKRLETLSTVMRQAFDDRLIKANPCVGITINVRKSTHTNAITTYHPFRYEQLLQLVTRGIAAGANPEMALTSLVTLDLGGRIGDMFGLLRGDFNLDEGLVTYHVRKVKKIHDVILFPGTVALLREYFEHHLVDQRPEAPLAPTFHVANDDDVPDDDFMHSSSDAGNYFAKFLVASGLRPIKPPRIVNGQGDYEQSFHSFRPTVSTALKLAGVPVEAVMARMPHKDEEVSKKYNRYTVHNICQRVFEGVGLPVPAGVKAKTSITTNQIFELIELGRQRLIQFRGQLDLHDGTEKYGQKTWRAELRPRSRHLHRRTLEIMDREAAEVAKTQADQPGKVPI